MANQTEEQIKAAAMQKQAAIKAAWTLGFSTCFITETNATKVKAATFTKWAMAGRERFANRVEEIKTTIRASVKTAAAAAKPAAASSGGW